MYALLDSGSYLRVRVIEQDETVRKVSAEVMHDLRKWFDPVVNAVHNDNLFVLIANYLYVSATDEDLRKLYVRKRLDTRPEPTLAEFRDFTLARLQCWGDIAWTKEYMKG